MFHLGGVGIILLDLAVDRTRPRSLRVSFGGAGGAAIVIAYAMAMLFLRIKIPGYLWVKRTLQLFNRVHPAISSFITYVSFHVELNIAHHVVSCETSSFGDIHALLLFINLAGLQ
ncbi:hypothetical protein ZWY2020_041658 [Hordeum vulgare]|nr:hypothetical protein ZWY2020_041658 [Hordeum vulgare]